MGMAHECDSTVFNIFLLLIIDDTGYGICGNTCIFTLPLYMLNVHSCTMMYMLGIVNDLFKNQCSRLSFANQLNFNM